jgi:signal transduction histidine kinase/DNA-binding response OmpR family regulator
MSDQARVLIIDDEPGIRDVLVEFLSPRGYSVEAVGSAKAGRERLERGDVDALILDLHLDQGHDGLALLEEVQGRNPDLCVLIITGFATTDSAIEALRRGADDYLQKPFELDALSRTLDRALERRRLRRQNRELVSHLRGANRKLARRGQELRERVDEATRSLRVLLDLARGLGKDLDLDQTLAGVAERARILTRARHALVFLRAANGERFDLAALKSPLAQQLGSRLGEMSHLMGEGLVGRAALFGRPVPLRFTGDALADGDPLAAFDPTVALAVPMLWEGTAIGTLVLLDRENGGGADTTDFGDSGVDAAGVAVSGGTGPVAEIVAIDGSGEIDDPDGDDEAVVTDIEFVAGVLPEVDLLDEIWDETDMDASLTSTLLDFTVEDEELALTFAAHAAVAIRNAQLYEEARRLDRLQSEFIAAVSHELRTPLAKMKASVELLSTYYGPELDTSAQELLSGSDIAVRQLEDQIELILASAEIETLASELAEEAVRRLTPVAAHKGIQIEIVAPDRPIMVQVDRRRFVRAISNLLSNAVKFSDSGDPVRLELETVGEQVRFHVIDRGIGIDPADQPHIFRRFAQIDGSLTRKAGGTGLGLCVSAALVERHGGEISVSSNLGEGTRFTVEVPAISTGHRVSKAA